MQTRAIAEKWFSIHTVSIDRIPDRPLNSKERHIRLVGDHGIKVELTATVEQADALITAFFHERDVGVQLLLPVEEMAGVQVNWKDERQSGMRISRE